jgi:RNA-directed DNA polymerase
MAAHLQVGQKHGHANKSRHWIVNRYFGAFNKSRRDRWVFGDRDSGAYLVRFAWTSIVRHRMVKGRASPDDPALAQYWADRRRRGAHTANPAQWEQWVGATPQAIRKQSLRYRTRDGSGETSDLGLIHTRCRGRPDAVTAPAERLLHASEPSGLA